MVDEVERVLRQGRYVCDRSLATVVYLALRTEKPLLPILTGTNDPVCPYGAKEVGEMATIGTPDALVSAVHDATELWITDLPIMPEKIALGLKRK